MPPFPVAPANPQGYSYQPAGSPATPATTFELNAAPSGFGQTSFFGTPNSGAAFGVSSGVQNNFAHTVARWAWDLGPTGADLCSIVIQTDGSIPSPEPVYDGHPFGFPAPLSIYRVSIEASDDGSSWHEVVSAETIFANVLPQSFASWSRNFIPIEERHHRYWSIKFDAQLGGGGFADLHFFPGLRLVSVSMYQLLT